MDRFDTLHLIGGLLTPWAVANIVTAEYNMYYYYLREINGKSNNGWLCNMFYAIGQQLMR